MSDIAAQADTIDGIRQGLEDVTKDRTYPAREALKSFRRDHGPPMKPLAVGTSTFGGSKNPNENFVQLVNSVPMNRVTSLLITFKNRSCCSKDAAREA